MSALSAIETALSVTTSALSSWVLDPVDRSAGLDDHRQQVALGAGDEGREAAERAAELDEHVRRAEADRDEKDRECVVGDVSQVEASKSMRRILPRRRADDARPDDGAVEVVERRDLPGRDAVRRLSSERVKPDFVGSTTVAIAGDR